jgi:3-deoxy-manno-octulosonate cytidylyltransferase (CMP-KDO synthetase)
MGDTKVVGLIPARYGSTRLPGKALELILGKPLIQRVYERSSQADVLDELVVATDDERIGRVVEGFGGRAVMTSPDHPSGTDRLAEAAQPMDADVLVNIQGDQPFIDPVMIEEVVQPLLDDASIGMSTLMHPISNPEDLQDPGVVKVVVDLAGFALYFSRSLIPYPREAEPHDVYEHVGLYAYRRAFLLKIAELAPTPLEKVELLEQLRVLEHGHSIRVVATACRDNEFSGFSVDTSADLARAEAMLRERRLE